MNVNLSNFYNHQSFMNDVRSGNRIIAQEEKRLASLPKETTNLKVGDRIVATDRATYLKGTVGRVLEIIANGPFLRVKVEWEVSKTPTFERLSDVSLI